MTSPLAQAAELMEAGLAIQRERFRREHPQASEAELDALLRAWRISPSSAPYGDAPGIVHFTWPRR